MNGDGRGHRSGPEPQSPTAPAGTFRSDDCHRKPARQAGDSWRAEHAIDVIGSADNHEDGELEVVIAAAASAANAQLQGQTAAGCSHHGGADGGGRVCVTSRKHSAPALIETRGGRGDEVMPSLDVAAATATAVAGSAAGNGRGSAARRLSAGCRRSSSAAASGERRDSRSLDDIADADECLHCRAAADGDGNEHTSCSCGSGVHRQLRRHSSQLQQQRSQNHQRQQLVRHGRCGCQPQQCYRCSTAVASSHVFVNDGVDGGVDDAASDSRAMHDCSSDDSDADYSDGCGGGAEADNGDRTAAAGCSRGDRNARRRYSSTDCHRCGGRAAAAAAAAGYVSGRQRLSLPIDDRRSAAAAAAAAAAASTAPDLRRTSKCKMHQRSKTVASLLGVPMAKTSREATANGGGSCDLRYARERSPSTEKDVWQRVKAKLSKYVFSPNIHSVDSKMAFLLNHEWANNSGLGCGGGGVGGVDGRHSASSSPPGGRRRPYRKGRSMEVDRMQAPVAGGNCGPPSLQQLQQLQQQQQQQQQPRRASYDCSDKPSGSSKASTRVTAAARGSSNDIVISAEIDAEALGRALQDMLLSVPAATAAAAAAAATVAATAAMEKPQAQSLG